MQIHRERDCETLPNPTPLNYVQCIADIVEMQLVSCILISPNWFTD